MFFFSCALLGSDTAAAYGESFWAKVKVEWGWGKNSPFQKSGRPLLEGYHLCFLCARLAAFLLRLLGLLLLLSRLDCYRLDLL